MRGLRGAHIVCHIQQDRDWFEQGELDFRSQGMGRKFQVKNH